MEIAKNIEILEETLWFKKEKIILLNDLHIGYEEALQRRGVLVPKFQLKEILSKLESILEKTRPEKVIINGDLKHEFGRVLRQEWKEVLEFLEFIINKGVEVIIIKGNHDHLMQVLANKKNITLINSYVLGDNLILHGDELVKEDINLKKFKRIIIGHEHPAIVLREGGKKEKYKCFLQGKWKNKELIVMPSFNPLLEGTDVSKEKLLSPFLTDISNFTVYIVGFREVLKFGKVKSFEKKFN
ncbi:metallophosphoesterase [Candidatus Woesearchaeota archaeon]|nr:metallophosphoesterase [Candidatus Woesearchaeota archaeon]